MPERRVRFYVVWGAIIGYMILVIYLFWALGLTVIRCPATLIEVMTMKTEPKKTAVRWKERIPHVRTGTPACDLPALSRRGYSAGPPARFRPRPIVSIRSGAGDSNTGEKRCADV